eukprot:TRINITY_DN712_c0_g1_i2.p1 TRINITY_DN712_c0_g1~~TRINITY_DN712_c0_g1_i2.p1  ORF type:complete len:624 (-),score=203.13 TRINITY_DN712_c0_g1_i2:132-1949(-)
MDTTNTSTTFSQPEFKEELAQKAEETMNTETYQVEVHKAVAMDAAVMAASKSEDFAKSAEAGFPAPKEAEGIIEIAKEKLGETAKEADNIIEIAKEKLGQVAETLSGAMETAKDNLKDMTDKIHMQLPGSTYVVGTTPDHSADTFAQPSFQEELSRKAQETMQSDTYQADVHRSVAMDAAVLAASKSEDFAKSAEAGFPAPKEAEGIIEIAKEKLGETAKEADNIIEIAKEKLGQVAETLSGAMETAKDNLKDMTDKIHMQLPGSTYVVGTTPDHSADTFAQPSFQEELSRKAQETMQSDTYQADVHRSVAMDAAVLAASKSEDFAKSAGAGFPAPKEAEGIIEIAKEKLGETVEVAKETIASLQKSLPGAMETARESTGHAYIATVNTITEAVELAKDKIGAISEKLPIQLPGTTNTNVTGTTPDHSADTFAQSEFKQELVQAAEEHMDTASVQYEAHKAVAKDAAVMAASKSEDFAKSAEAGFPAPKEEAEGYINVAKEKLGETVEVAKDTLASAQQSVTGALDTAQATAGQAYTTTVNTIGSTVEAAREKIGEGLEFAAEKMREAGEALAAQSADTKEKGVQMQRSAELNSARYNLTPSTTI